MFQFKAFFLLLLTSCVVEGRYNYDFGGSDNFAAMSAKLDTFISSLDQVGKELQSLNTAYKGMRAEQTKNSKLTEEFQTFDVEDAAPVYAREEFLLGSALGNDWNNKVYCEASEAENKVEMRGGERTEIKRIFCPRINTFLAAVQHAESGHITGICCERKKNKKKKN